MDNDAAVASKVQAAVPPVPAAQDSPKPWALYANELAVQRNADFLMYSGTIRAPFDEELSKLVLNRRRRPNVVLVLATFGGDPNAAYRIARCLRHAYHEFVVMVAGFCKSAGTLLVLGADSILFTERAELGPLDVQVRKSDEVAEQSSGLTPIQALQTLNTRTFESFRDHFVKLKFHLQMTSRTATEIATELTARLYAPIAAQMDPMRIGEMERAMKIAREYGQRLANDSNNLKPDALERLVAGYPSHEFVVDFNEARDLFIRVALASEQGKKLIELIGPLASIPYDRPDRYWLAYLNDELSPNTPDDKRAPVSPADVVDTSSSGTSA